MSCSTHFGGPQAGRAAGGSKQQSGTICCGPVSTLICVRAGIERVSCGTKVKWWQCSVLWQRLADRYGICCMECGEHVVAGVGSTAAAAAAVIRTGGGARACTVLLRSCNWVRCSTHDRQHMWQQQEVVDTFACKAVLGQSDVWCVEGAAVTGHCMWCGAIRSV
jgi:hypothetical protein